MAYFKRLKKARYDTTAKRLARQDKGIEEGANSTELRRDKYYNDEEYRDKIKEDSREYYRENKRVGVYEDSKIGDSLSIDGQLREVTVPNKKMVIRCETYNVDEAAQALNKSGRTFRYWIKGGLIPPPILCSTHPNRKYYARGEVEVMARILRVHEKRLDYFRFDHTATIKALWLAVMNFRQM